MTYLNLMLAVVAIQQVLDVWTTRVALATGRATEANTPLKHLMDKVGIMPALISIKLAFGAMIVLTIQDTTGWYISLGAIIILYTYVLYNNFTVLRRLGVL